MLQKVLCATSNNCMYVIYILYNGTFQHLDFHSIENTHFYYYALPVSHKNNLFALDYILLHFIDSKNENIIAVIVGHGSKYLSEVLLLTTKRFRNLYKH